MRMASANMATIDLSDEEEVESRHHIQRLKAAVHYTVGQICKEVGAKNDVTFSKPTIAAISELTFHQSQLFASDLEHFSKHAKRATINEEDVKLLVRRNAKLGEYIQKFSDELVQDRLAEKSKKKLKKRKLDQAGASTSAAADLLIDSDNTTEY